MELHYHMGSTCLRSPQKKTINPIFFLLFKNPKLFTFLMQFITQSYKITRFSVKVISLREEFNLLVTKIKDLKIIFSKLFWWLAAAIYKYKLDF